MHPALRPRDASSPRRLLDRRHGVADNPIGRIDNGRSARRPTVVIAFLLYAAVLCGLTRTQAGSTNSQSRLMTMKMLVERGTLRLDDAPFVPVDHVTIDGHDYSDKPPVLPAVGAVVYAGLYGAGYELYGEAPEEKEYRRRRDHQFAVLVITWVLVGLSAAAATACFLLRLGELVSDEMSRLGLWLTFAFGTLFFSYSVELNNHVVAGSFLWLAFSLTFLAPMDRAAGAPRAGGWCSLRLAAAGLFAGLALTIDPPAGALFLAVFTHHLAREAGDRWRTLACFAAGLTPPLTLHCILQPLVTGSVLPAQFYYPQFFPEALRAEAGPSDLMSRISYTGQFLFGFQGLFWITPTLLFCPLGVLHLARHGNCRERRAALATALVTAGLISYYGFFAPANHGGEAFGFRWLISVTPIWCYFACVFYVETSRRWTRWVFWACACWSIVAATSGAQAPWLREHGNWWLIGKVIG